jgi:hypothetical protein
MSAHFLSLLWVSDETHVQLRRLERRSLLTALVETKLAARA